MVSRKLFSSLYTTLGIIFILMLFLMVIYENVKQFANPSLTLWESHFITILFTSLLAVVILYYPLRTAHREQQNAKDALLHQLEAEEKLRQSEMQYRSFVESAEDSLYTVDLDLRYLLINTRHLARRGLSPDMYFGKRYGDFHSEQETGSLLPPWIRLSKQRVMSRMSTSRTDGISSASSTRLSTLRITRSRPSR
jgi:PAS domain-containing protein